MPKRVEPIEKKCKACGNVFLAKTTYQRTKQKFCNHTCRSQVMGNGRDVVLTDRRCKTCKVMMQVMPCHLKTKFYCSYKCTGDGRDVAGPNNPAWKGGIGNNGRYWKRQARIRDDYTCRYWDCGKRDKGNGTHAHHITPTIVSNDHRLSNLVTLCSKHHKELEMELFKALVTAYPKATKRLAKALYPDVA